MTSFVEFNICVAVDHPSLPGHFPGQPIVPGVLLLDHVFNGLLRSTGRRVVRLQQARFNNALLPGESAHARCEIDASRASFRVEAMRDGVVTPIADGNCTLDTIEADGAVA